MTPKYSRRCSALILIIPEYPAYREQSAKAQGSRADDEEVTWFKQTIDNACGLYTILHGVCNISNPISRMKGNINTCLFCVADGSFLDHPMKSKDRTEFLENLEYLDAVYHEAATSGSSEAPPAEDEI